MKKAQRLSGFSITDRCANGFLFVRRHVIHFPIQFVLVMLAISSCAVSPAQAATNANKVDIALQASVVEALAIVVANPAVAFGVVTPGVRNAAPLSQALAITSTWLLSAGETVKLYAYFDSASSAMTGTLLGDVIPTSAVTAAFNGGSTQSFTQTSPFTASATAINLYAVAITSGNSITTARLDSLALALNLTGITLHADTYVGVMHIQAQAL